MELQHIMNTKKFDSCTVQALLKIQLTGVLGTSLGRSGLII